MPMKHRRWFWKIVRIAVIARVTGKIVLYNFTDIIIKCEVKNVLYYPFSCYFVLYHLYRYSTIPVLYLYNTGIIAAIVLYRYKTQLYIQLKALYRKRYIVIKIIGLRLSSCNGNPRLRLSCVQRRYTETR